MTEDPTDYVPEDYCKYAAFGRVIVNGKHIRIETDGNGRLIEIVEYTNGGCYGVPRDALKKPETPDIPKQDHTNSNRVRRRKARLIRIHRYVERHPGPTKWDIAARFDISSATAWHDLNELRQQGKLIMKDRRGSEQDSNGAWYAIC